MHFNEFVVYNALTYKTPLYLQILRNFFSLARESRSLENLSLRCSKNGIWGIATYIQMEKEFYTFKACESSKDFMIVVEALIKPLGYQIKFICGIISFTIFATFTQF